MTQAVAGQNADEIAFTEAQYQDYWDRNTHAMVSYLARARYAMRRVKPFAEFSKEIGLVPTGVAASYRCRGRAGWLTLAESVDLLRRLGPINDHRVHLAGRGPALQLAQ